MKDGISIEPAYFDVQVDVVPVSPLGVVSVLHETTKGFLVQTVLRVSNVLYQFVLKWQYAALIIRRVGIGNILANHMVVEHSRIHHATKDINLEGCNVHAGNIGQVKQALERLGQSPRSQNCDVVKERCYQCRQKAHRCRTLRWILIESLS